MSLLRRLALPSPTSTETTGREFDRRRSVLPRHGMSKSGGAPHPPQRGGEFLDTRWVCADPGVLTYYFGPAV
jgi:hypothetical protein